MTNSQSKSKLTKNSDNNLDRLRWISFILDKAIPIPGTSYRIGVDPILGFIPGAGDYLGAAVSAYIVLQAAQMGASRNTLSRMVFNIVLDTVIGSLPILGDFFDFAWKANTKNIALLETHLNSPHKSKKADRWFVILLLTGLLLVVIGITAVGLFVLRLLLQAISN
jgi:Domain of unknown function (DUF4112)